MVKITPSPRRSLDLENNDRGKKVGARGGGREVGKEGAGGERDTDGGSPDG